MDNKLKDSVDITLNDIAENKNIYSTGRVVRVNKYNIEVSGLNDVSFYEAVEITNKARGYVMGIYPDHVIVSLVEITEEVVPGDIIYALKKRIQMPL